MRLRGPRSAQLDLRPRTLVHTRARTHRPGSRDVLALPAACRTQPTETVAVGVLRRSGRGAFSVQVVAAG